MENRICFFLAKEKLEHKNKIYPLLKEEIEYIITEESVRVFWIVDKGDINEMAFKCIKELKEKYNDIFAVNIVTDFDIEKKKYYKEFDGIYFVDIPEDAESCIKYMIKNADCMISYACRAEQERLIVRDAVENGIKNFAIYEV